MNDSKLQQRLRKNSTGTSPRNVGRDRRKTAKRTNWKRFANESKLKKSQSVRSAASNSSEPDFKLEDEKKETDNLKETKVSRRRGQKGRRNRQRNRKNKSGLQACTKPLPMGTPLWKIVNQTTVATYHTFLGYRLVHPGSVSYTNRTKVFKFVAYDPESIVRQTKNMYSDSPKASQDKDKTGYFIEGGGLPFPIHFGNRDSDKRNRDNCFWSMIKWGKLWRDRAENDLVETIECTFSRKEGPIGIKIAERDNSMTVAKDSPAFKAGVRCGWRVLKVGSNWVNPSTVVAELENILKTSEDDIKMDNEYKVSFAKTSPWPQQEKASFIKKFLVREYWRGAILSACTLTASIFTGYLVKREIEVFVSQVKEEAFDTGSDIAIDFLLRLCFQAGDSLMSRTMLDTLDDDIHSEIMDELADQAKEYFMTLTEWDNAQPPAICHIFSRLFNLYPSAKRRFYPGRALSVWFRGVSLDFLQSIQGKIDRNWTTEDVKNKYVLEATQATETKLMADLAKPDQRGPASIFISHAWKNRYYELVEACKNYPGEFFFNDIIAIQQHRMKSDEMIEDLKALPSIISYSSCCLLISDMKLSPLRRIWCLFELYHCLVTTSSKLIVCFTSEGLADESDIGLWDAAREIEERIGTIDVSKAQATVEADKHRILDEIERKVPGGIEMFNIRLIAALKNEWAKNIRELWGWRMMETVGRAVRKVGMLEKEVVSLKGTLASLLSRVEDLEGFR